MENVIEAKIITKPSASKTLISLEIGIPTLFKTSDFKAQHIRVVASELKSKKGYEFTVSEDGMVNSFIVTCLAKPKKEVKK